MPGFDHHRVYLIQNLRREQRDVYRTMFGADSACPYHNNPCPHVSRRNVILIVRGLLQFS